MCKQTEVTAKRTVSQAGQRDLMSHYTALEYLWYVKSDMITWPFKLTLLWWVESRFQAVQELIKTQLPVGIFVRELDEGVNTQAPGKHNQTYMQTHT